MPKVRLLFCSSLLFPSKLIASYKDAQKWSQVSSFNDFYLPLSEMFVICTMEYQWAYWFRGV